MALELVPSNIHNIIHLIKAYEEKLYITAIAAFQYQRRKLSTLNLCSCGCL